MFIDMHCHSTSSDDSRATVEQYLKWATVLHQRGYRIDAIVLTEHRKYDGDADYSTLSQRYGTLVLKGSELETRYGHFLVYGVTERLLRVVNFADVGLDPFELMAVARTCGATVIPAHPGRTGIGLCEFVQQGIRFPGVSIVETLNGGSRRGENERAQRLAQERDYRGIGGSDAHFVSALGTCLTRFDTTIRDETALVEALLSGGFRPVRLEETRDGATPSRQEAAR